MRISDWKLTNSTFIITLSSNRNERNYWLSIIAYRFVLHANERSGSECLCDKKVINPSNPFTEMMWLRYTSFFFLNNLIPKLAAVTYLVAFSLQSDISKCTQSTSQVETVAKIELISCHPLHLPRLKEIEHLAFSPDTHYLITRPSLFRFICRSPSTSHYEPQALHPGVRLWSAGFENQRPVSWDTVPRH